MVVVELILIILCIFPLMLGIADILHNLKLFLLGGKVKSQKTVIFLLDDEFPQRELALIAEQKRWQGKAFADKVYVIYTKLSKNEILECENIARKNNIFLYSLKDFSADFSLFFNYYNL